MLNSLTRNTAARAVLAAAAGFGLIVALAACTSEPESEEVLGNNSAEADYDDWAIDFDACMKAEGIEMGSAVTNDGSTSTESKTLDVGSVDMEAFAAANKKCIAEVGEPPVQPGTPSDKEMNEMALAFAKCMREAGYDYPDPEPVGEGSGMVEAQPFNADDFDKADMDACSAKAGYSDAGSSE